MTERIPNNPFDAIVQNLRNEMVDPALEPFLRRAQEYAKEIDGMRMSPHEARKIKDELNQLLSEVAGTNEDVEVRVSGKGRLLREEDTRLLGYSKHSPHLHAFQPGVTEKFDDDGSYYPLHRQLGTLDYISLDPDEDFGNGAATTYRITFRLTLSEYNYDELAEYDAFDDEDDDRDRDPDDHDEDDDDDDDMSDDSDETAFDIFIYANDLDVLELSQTSTEKVARDLCKYFPDVAAQLDQLPRNPLDEAETIRAIKDLVLRFDWSQTPYRTSDERQDVIDVVGSILIEKMQLDSSMYRIDYQGRIFGIRPDGSKVCQIEGSRKDMYGIFVGCALAKIEDDANLNDDVIEYEPTVLVSAPAPGRDKGDLLLILPTSSVFNVTNLRNQPIFSMKLQENPTVFEPQMMEDFEGGESADLDDNGKGISLETDDESDDEEKPELTQEQLETLLKDFATLRNLLRQAAEKTNLTYEEALEVQEFMNIHITAFFEKYVGTLTAEMVFTGEFLEFVDPLFNLDTIDKVSDLPEIAFSKLVVKKGDFMTTKRGLFTGNCQVNLVPNEPSGEITYRVAPYMFFLDSIGNNTVRFTPPGGSYSVPLYEIKAETKFAVLLTEQGSIELPALTKIQRRREAIERITSSLPELPELPEYLANIQARIDAENPSMYIEVQPELLQGVSASIAKDERAVPLVTDALVAIMGHRQINIEGGSYDKTGSPSEASVLNGELISIVDGAPNATTHEPTLVVIDGNKNTLYLPLSKVTHLSI